MFNVRVKACLHSEVTLKYFTGSDHPIWESAGYTATFAATNYDPMADGNHISVGGKDMPSWPEELIISDTQKPFRGGYLRELITAYRPSGSRTGDTEDSNADDA